MAAIKTYRKIDPAAQQQTSVVLDKSGMGSWWALPESDKMV